VLVAVRDQGQEARALDGGVQLALIDGARAGQARGDDLAVLGDEVAKRVDVLVVDLFDAGDGEARQKRLRLNSSDWVLRFGRLSLLNFLIAGMWASLGIWNE